MNGWINQLIKPVSESVNKSTQPINHSKTVWVTCQLQFKLNWDADITVYTCTTNGTPLCRVFLTHRDGGWFNKSSYTCTCFHPLFFPPSSSSSSGNQLVYINSILLGQGWIYSWEDCGQTFSHRTTPITLLTQPYRPYQLHRATPITFLTQPYRWYQLHRATPVMFLTQPYRPYQLHRATQIALLTIEPRQSHSSP